MEKNVSPNGRNLVLKLVMHEWKNMTGRLETPTLPHRPPTPHMHAHARRRSPCILNSQLITSHRCRRVHPRWCFFFSFFLFPFLHYSERERRHRKGETLPTRKGADPTRLRCAATRGSCKEEHDTRWHSCKDGARVCDFWPFVCAGFCKKRPVHMFRNFTEPVCKGVSSKVLANAGF